MGGREGGFVGLLDEARRERELVAVVFEREGDGSLVLSAGLSSREKCVCARFGAARVRPDGEVRGDDVHVRGGDVASFEDAREAGREPARDGRRVGREEDARAGRGRRCAQGHEEEEHTTHNSHLTKKGKHAKRRFGAELPAAVHSRRVAVEAQLGADPQARAPEAARLSLSLSLSLSSSPQRGAFARAPRRCVGKTRNSEFLKHASRALVGRGASVRASRGVARREPLERLVRSKPSFSTVSRTRRCNVSLRDFTARQSRPLSDRPREGES